MLKALVANTMHDEGSQTEKSDRRKTAPEKKSLNDEILDIFEDKGFEVRQYGSLRLKYDRILKFSSTYDLEIFKPSPDSHHLFVSSVPIREISEIKPKRPGSQKLIVSFKNPKKYQKTKFMFKNFEEGQKFITFFCKLLESAENSKSAVLVTYLEN